MLREAIAEHQQRFYGLDYDPDSEVLVTAGATEALAGALLGLLDTGDEVVLFEPMYDSYQACIALAGATAKPVTLRPPDYAVDLDALRAAITAKTRAAAGQQPAQPDGHGAVAATRLAAIADDRRGARPDRRLRRGLRAPHVRRHRARPAVHVPRDARADAADLERRQDVQHHGLEDRLGLRPGAARRRGAHRQAVPDLRQRRAVPAGDRRRAAPAGRVLRRRSAPTCEAKRDRLVPGLVEAGFEVFPTRGTYFVTVDIRPLRADGDGLAFCRELPERCGIVAIPNEVFYVNRHEGRHLVRFAFCKRFDVLDEAVARLKSLA